MFAGAWFRKQVLEASKDIEEIVNKFKKAKKIKKKLKKKLGFKFSKKEVKSMKKAKFGISHTRDWYMRAGVQWNYTNLNNATDFEPN